jgi:hypothetical protein
MQHIAYRDQSVSIGKYGVLFYSDALLAIDSPMSLMSWVFVIPDFLVFTFFSGVFGNTFVFAAFLSSVLAGAFFVAILISLTI